MRAASIGLVLSLVAACGGKAATSSGPPAGGRVAAPATLPEYCDEYRACAAESVQMEREVSDLEALSPDQRAEFDASVEARLESCAATYTALAPYQREWLEACTGCGGSCDVYDCLDQAPEIAEGVAFECDLDDGGDDGGGDQED